MKRILYYGIAIALCLGGCGVAQEDDLRGVPVTNNPTLIPSMGHTVQGPSF